MKRTASILLIGLVAAALAFAGAIRLLTVSHDSGAPGQAVPELAWLKQEFKLSDAEFARIASLHSSYAPRCESMCKMIDQKSAEITHLLAQTNAITPEIEQRL